MIEVGLAEDPVYTRLALSLTLSFQEILGQPDLVIAEVCAAAQARTVGRAIARSAVEIQRRFLRCCSPGKASEVREIFSEEVTLREVGGAQLQMVVVTRELERKGVLQFKRIPLQTVLVG
jgi:flagellar motor switch protein FliG